MQLQLAAADHELVELLVGLATKIAIEAVEHDPLGVGQHRVGAAGGLRFVLSGPHPTGDLLGGGKVTGVGEDTRDLHVHRIHDP